MHTPLSRTALIWPLLALAACRDPQVTSYRAPKDQAPPAPPPAPAASPGMALDPSAPALVTASGLALAWTAPDDWQARAPGPMRKGSYTVPGPDSASADLAITAFPGDVGGDLANVNRWRNQLGLPPVGATELEPMLQRFPVGDLTVAVADLLGPGDEPTRMLCAFAAHDGATWFFKLTGPASVVAAQKPAFLAFARTIRPAPDPVLP